MLYVSLSIYIYMKLWDSFRWFSQLLVALFFERTGWNAEKA